MIGILYIYGFCMCVNRLGKIVNLVFGNKIEIDNLFGYECGINRKFWVLLICWLILFFSNEFIGVIIGCVFCGVVGYRDRYEYIGLLYLNYMVFFVFIKLFVCNW